MTPFINLKEQLKYFNHDKEIAMIVSESFLESVPSMINELNDTLVNNNQNLFIDKIHALKGAIGVFGPNPFFDYVKKYYFDVQQNPDLCITIENFNQIKMMFLQFEFEIKSFVKYLENNSLE